MNGFVKRSALLGRWTNNTLRTRENKQIIRPSYSLDEKSAAHMRMHEFIVQ